MEILRNPFKRFDLPIAIFERDFADQRSSTALGQAGNCFISACQRHSDRSIIPEDTDSYGLMSGFPNEKYREVITHQL